MADPVTAVKTRPIIPARLACALLALLFAALLSGCATPGEESELPWNTPQSWEGCPGIPGLESR